MQGDTPFLQTSLFLSSTARQLLDNLARRRGPAERTLSDDEIEQWLDRLTAERGAAEMKPAARRRQIACTRAGASAGDGPPRRAGR